MTEKLLTNAIIQHLNYSGKCWVWRVNSGMASMTSSNGKKRYIKLAQAGSSDIQGIRNDGKFVALEVKKPETRKTVTKLQNQFLNDISSKGGVVGVVTSGEEAMAIIEGKDVFNPYEFENNVANESTL